MFKQTMENQVRSAATALIRDGFETNLDLFLPHKFELDTKKWGITIIKGPQLHKNDDSIVDGIVISTCSPTEVHITVKPFKELTEKVSFEYADPKFPDNLFKYVAFYIGTWVSWWDIFKEEYPETIERIVELYGD